MAVITVDQLAEIKSGKWLPPEAADNGWDDATIALRWVGDFPHTVRQYWYERVQNTAKYLDLSDPSGNLPITQIHRQAKEMLDYWDNWILKFGSNTEPQRGVKFGKIRRRYPRGGTYPVPAGPSSRGPYNYTG